MKSALVSVSRKWQSRSKFRPGHRRFDIALFFRKFHKVKFEICNKVKISIFRNQLKETLNQNQTQEIVFNSFLYWNQTAPVLMLKSWSLEWEPNQTRNPCKQTIIVFNFIKKNKCHSKAIVDTSDTHFQYLAEVSKCGGGGLSVKLTTSRPPDLMTPFGWMEENT